jgi:hypothetical protein
MDPAALEAGLVVLTALTWCTSNAGGTLAHLLTTQVTGLCRVIGRGVMLTSAASRWTVPAWS